MYKIESIKVLFHDKDDGLSFNEIFQLEDDGWELHYLFDPSEVPLLKSIGDKEL